MISISSVIINYSIIYGDCGSAAVASAVPVRDAVLVSYEQL